MNNRVRNLNRKSRRAAGFSLIEILVVLAILVIGVLGIIRIFPYGFLAIQHTAEQTNASALANQQLEYEKNAVSVPEAIVAMAPGGAISNTVQPDDLNPDSTLGSDVNKIRYVMGETFRVPTAFGSPAASGVSYGAVYTAQYGPIYYNAGDATDPQNPQVTGTPLQRVEQASIDDNGATTTPNLTSAAEYAIDYDRMMIAFYPVAGGNPRKFQFNYTYYTTPVSGVPGIQTILSGTNKIVVTPATLAMNPNLLPVWQPIFDPVNNIMPTGATAMDISLGIRRGSEDVSRAFTLVNPTPFEGVSTPPTWSDDPYEYAIYSANASTNNGNGGANVGVFLFNPRGHNETVATATGTQPFSARISYQIFDNHIIRDQRSVPSVAPFDIRLSLPNISTTGDVQLDQTNFDGLFGNNTPNLLIYNANNGQLITKGSGECLPGSPPNDQIGGVDNFTVDAKTGVVHFDDNFIKNNNLQNVTLRIYYHTQKNFGQQLQKACAHYYAVNDPSTMIYNNYFVGDGVTAGSVKGRIYFPLCEMGKSVTIGSVNYIDKNGNPQHSSGGNYQISSNPGTFDAVQRPYVTLADDFGNLPDPVKTGIMPVDNVQGISMKSRVIWLRSVQLSNATNPPTPTYHWRKLDNDTILTPNPTH